MLLAILFPHFIEECIIIYHIATTNCAALHIKICLYHVRRPTAYSILGNFVINKLHCSLYVSKLYFSSHNYIHISELQTHYLYYIISKYKAYAIK